MKHLLDTSALCAHFLHEPGGDQVSVLFSENPAQLAVCVITWFEMRGALERCGVASHLVDRALDLYRELPLSSLSVTEPVVDRAVQLRGAAARRLPLADALIAGCAAVHGMVLVHRDAHFDALPADSVKRHRLQDPPADATSEDVPPVVRESPPAYPARRTRKKEKKS